MILAYLDETGHTGSDLRSETGQPYHWVAALLVQETIWIDTTKAVTAIREFAREVGFTGKHCELHGAQIFQGQKGWRQVSIENRLAVMEKCAETVEKHNVKIAFGGCNKQLLKRTYSQPHHPHDLATWLCLERVARYANARNELTVLIADDCSPDHKRLSRGALSRYRTYGAPFGPTVNFDCLLDTIHYMSSSESPHIQLSDVLLYIFQRYRNLHDERLKALFLQVHRCKTGDIGVIPY